MVKPLTGVAARRAKDADIGEKKLRGEVKDLRRTKPRSDD